MPGAWSLLLSAAAASCFWLHPINQFGVSAPAEILALVLFVFVGVGVSLLSELLQRSRRRLAVDQRERLSLAQERLALLDYTGQAILGVALDGRCIFANRACAEMLGGSPSSVLGRDVRELVPDHRGERSPSLREQIIQRSDGASFLAESWAHPIFVEGRMTGTVVALTDLTERRRAELERREIAARKRIEEELRRLLMAEHEAREQAEAAAATLRKLQLVTDHALSQLGLHELLVELMRRIREVLACDTATVLLWDESRRGLRPIESEGLREELFENLCIPLGTGVAGCIAESAGGLIFNDLADVEVVSPFLRKRVRSLVGVPLRSGDTLVGVLHVGAATPRVFTEADLDFLRRVADRAVLAIDRAHLAESERHARAEAEHANRSKDEFLAVLSHELRTPLTAMLGWVTLLRTGRVSPAQTERALESIERNTRLQARLIEDLLDLSRAITGKLLLDLRPVALGPIVQDAAESLAGATAEKGVKLTVAPDPATVRGDALRLGQVVTNLVGNAVKFTPAGGDITVRLERVGNDARLTVRDTGLGGAPPARCRRDGRG